MEASLELSDGRAKLCRSQVADRQGIRLWKGVAKASRKVGSLARLLKKSGVRLPDRRRLLSGNSTFSWCVPEDLLAVAIKRSACPAGTIATLPARGPPGDR